jgi:hypothetical protein
VRQKHPATTRTPERHTAVTKWAQSPSVADDDPGGRGERQAGGQDPEVHAVGIGDDHHIGGADYRSGAAVGAAEKSADG